MVDLGHQGDLGSAKRLYTSTLVDEVTRLLSLATLERISERFLVPALKGLLQAFPFGIQAVHADKGSEYVNHRVDGLLHKLDSGQITKSGTRQTNDNALARCKNAAGVRE